MGDPWRSRELEWPSALPAPYSFTHGLETLEADEEPGWEGLGLSGDLPARTIPLPPMPRFTGR